jgi:HPt (histidine-containing phosphotransfer) domain-containing protein
MSMQILNEHKLRYLSRRLIEIEELKKSLEVENYELAITIGHRLKGNGETFGFPEISTIGISLEQAALLHDKVKMKESIDNLLQNVSENLKEFE